MRGHMKVFASDTEYDSILDAEHASWIEIWDVFERLTGLSREQEWGELKRAIEAWQPLRARLEAANRERSLSQ